MIRGLTDGSCEYDQRDRERASQTGWWVRRRLETVS